MVRARTLLAALVSTLFALSLAVPAVYACPPQTIEYTYYTDASKTVQCGWKFITCSCGVFSDGCQTPHYDIDYSECMTADPPDDQSAAVGEEPQPLPSSTSSVAPGCNQGDALEGLFAMQR